MKLKKIANKTLSLFLEHRNLIDFSARTFNLAQYIYSKQYVDAVKSGIELVGAVGEDYYYSEDFLNNYNGWEKLFNDNETHIVNLFDLDKYPCRVIKLKGTATISIYTLPNKMEIAMRESTYWYEKQKMLYYNTHYAERSAIVNILTKELFDRLNSQCMILCDDNLDKTKSNITIKPYVLEEYSSVISTQLQQYLIKSMDMNVPRSIMLYSEPGSGKTVIASTALVGLNLKTLKIDNFNKVSTDFVQLLVKIFKIEAILIDDFDHMSINNGSMMLDFLEKVRKQVKVIIATVNSTKAFHKALLRPGRFDKIIHVKSLDEKVVKGILGDELLPYFDKVKDWPVAFINELAINHKLEAHVSIDEMIDNLQKRVGDNNEDTIDFHEKKKDKKEKSSKEDDD